MYRGHSAGTAENGGSGTAQLTASETDSDSGSATLPITPQSSGGGTAEGDASPVTNVTSPKRKWEEKKSGWCDGCDEDHKELLTLVHRPVKTSSFDYTCEPDCGSGEGMHLRAEETFHLSSRGRAATKLEVEWDMVVCCHRSTEGETFSESLS